jgi:hypothetical protein
LTTITRLVSGQPTGQPASGHKYTFVQAGTIAGKKVVKSNQVVLAKDWASMSAARAIFFGLISGIS